MRKDGTNIPTNVGGGDAADVDEEGGALPPAAASTDAELFIGS